MMPRTPILPAFVPLLFFCAACSQFPEVREAEQKLLSAQAAPSLVPVEDLLALDTSPRATDGSINAVESRADRLRARAAALRRTSVTEP